MTPTRDLDTLGQIIRRSAIGCAVTVAFLVALAKCNAPDLEPALPRCPHITSSVDAGPCQP